MKILYIIVFFLFLLAPHVDSIFSIDKTIGRENRELTKFPELSETKLKEWPKNLTDYVNDNFGFRKWLIQTNAKLKYHIFKSAPNKNVLIADNGFMFFNHSPGEGPIIFEDFTHRNTLDQEEMQKVEDAYRSRIRHLKKANIDYYCGFYPNKHSIYQEELPYRAKKCILDHPSKADQIMNHLSENGVVKVIDFRPSLKKKKEDYSLYVKGDTHWNEMGAFVAYQHMFNRISKKHPSLKPKTLKDFDTYWYSNVADWKAEKKEKCGDRCYDGYLVGMDKTLYSPLGLKRMMGFSLGTLQDSFPVLIPKTKTRATRIIEEMKSPRDRRLEIYNNPDKPNGLTALVFRDSYTLSMIKFLYPHFKKTVIVKGPYRQVRVNKYNPDIVIDCHVERHFKS